MPIAIVTEPTEERLALAHKGFAGFAIEGNNVRIPAHYHGCIVGVTLGR